MTLFAVAMTPGGRYPRHSAESRLDIDENNLSGCVPNDLQFQLSPEATLEAWSTVDEALGSHIRTTGGPTTMTTTRSPFLSQSYGAL